MPFSKFPDAKKIMKEYGQEGKWYKLGRMPFRIAADSEGNVIEKHWGQSMKDIPEIEEVLSLYSDKGKELINYNITIRTSLGINIQDVFLMKQIGGRMKKTIRREQYD